MTNIQYSKLRFHHDEWGQLVLTLADGSLRAGIEPIRCFPLSDPARTIALLDAEGHELLNLPNLDVLDSAARDVLQRELAAREFVPVIRRIVATNAPNPPVVETDRGQTSFQLESDDDCRRLGEQGAVIADSNGIRYSIPDISRLDAASQRILRRLV
jgi:hypothetical protein